VIIRPEVFSLEGRVDVRDLVREIDRREEERAIERPRARQRRRPIAPPARTRSSRVW